MGAGCDILIAIGMVYYVRPDMFHKFCFHLIHISQLVKTRARILIKSKQDVIARLIGQSVRTGTFMALCAILNLSFFLAFKSNAIQNIP